MTGNYVDKEVETVFTEVVPTTNPDTDQEVTMSASTIPARLANMTAGTIPTGTNLPGFGTITRVSLTAYEVHSSEGGLQWLPFVHVHGLRPAEPLVVFA